MREAFNAKFSEQWGNSCLVFILWNPLKLQGELNATTDKLHHAQREVKELKDKQTELKGRYEERMELAQQKAANDLRDAVLQAKEEAAAKMDELREKHATELARITAAH